MSWWTQIHGTLTLESSEVFTSTEDLEKYANYAIKEICKRSGEITGSEGPATIFVNAYPHSTSFGPFGAGYSKAYLTFHGSLRDRIITRTEAELRKFLDRLQHYFRVEDILIKIDDYKYSKIFMDKDFNLYQTEMIKLPYNYDDEPDPETSDPDVVKKYEEKEEQQWRIRHLNFEKYFKSLFDEDKINRYKWVLDHMNLSVLDDILGDVDAIADVAISRDYLERRKERKMPIPKEFEEGLEDERSSEEEAVL